MVVLVFHYLTDNDIDKCSEIFKKLDFIEISKSENDVFYLHKAIPAIANIFRIESIKGKKEGELTEIHIEALISSPYEGYNWKIAISIISEISRKVEGEIEDLMFDW